LQHITTLSAHQSLTVLLTDTPHHQLLAVLLTHFHLIIPITVLNIHKRS